MIKKFSVITLSFLLLIVLSACEAFKKPNPEGEAEGTLKEYTADDELSSEKAKEGIEESPETPETRAENAESKNKISTPPPSKTSSGTEKKSESQEPKSKEATKENLKKETPKSEVKTFSVTAKQFEFSPSSITVNEGDTVRISIKTEDATHGFVIPDFGINKVINPGSTVTVEFVADKKGTFPFRCSVYCGDGHGGMTGSLTVK